MSAVHAGEIITNPTHECTLIQFADTMKRNFQGVDDEDVILIGHSTILKRFVK